LFKNVYKAKEQMQGILQKVFKTLAFGEGKNV
jgi:hypothetical protein